MEQNIRAQDRIYNRIALAFVMFGLMVFVSSCSKKEETKVLYYNVDSLVSAQGNFLESVKARLKKEVALGVKTDTTTTVPDSVAWQTELDVFRQLDVINRPINKSAYTITGGADTRSNLNFRSYECKKNLPERSLKTLPVKNLKIYYQESLSRPRRIEALFEEENSLYKSSRKLEMGFQNINNKTVLTSYSIEGGQKMFLGDSVEFSLRGKITVH